MPTNSITELNDLIYVGVKLVCEKIEVSLKTTDRKLKLGWELRLESQQAKMLKRNMKISSDEAEKERQIERKVQLEETKQKVLVKEGRLKRYRDRTKQYKQQDIPKQRKKILPASTRRIDEDISATGKNILEQNMRTEDDNQKAK